MIYEFLVSWQIKVATSGMPKMQLIISKREEHPFWKDNQTENPFGKNTIKKITFSEESYTEESTISEETTA